jgi:hypothetical protein
MSVETTAASSAARDSPCLCDSARPAPATVWRFVLRTAFAGLALIYFGWNLYWLVQLRLAPSLFQALTGLPCPTTGCTRSMLALLRGELSESLRYNALTVPICLLLAATCSQLLGQGLARKRLALSSWLVWVWAVILPLAWLLKLAGNPAYW